jgi:hypothetical protein
VARLPRGLVDLPRLLAPADLATDDTFADHQLEIVDRRLVPEREGVDRLHGVVEGVAEGLLDGGAGHERGDLDPDRRVPERHLHDGALWGHRLQGTGGGWIVHVVRPGSRGEGEGRGSEKGRRGHGSLLAC